MSEVRAKFESVVRLVFPLAGLLDDHCSNSDAVM